MGEELGRIAPVAGDLLPLLWHWMIAYSVAVARPMTLVAIHPLFSRFQVSGLLRGAVATALSVPAILAVSHSLDEAHLGSVMLLLLALKEAAVGAALGLMLGIPFWAMAVAGDIVDLQRGSSSGRIQDPSGSEDVSITGTFLLLAGAALFVATGGLPMTAGLLLHSWEIWRPLAPLPAINGRLPLILLALLDDVTRQGLRLAIPVVLAMLLADVTLILIGRVAPHLRIDDQATVARNLVFFLFIPIYVGYLLTYAEANFRHVPHALDVFGAFFEHPNR